MHEVIVYRNPIEAAFWNMLQSPFFFVALVWAVLAIVCTVLSFRIFDKLFFNRVRTFNNKVRGYIYNTVLVAALALATVITYVIFY